MGEVVEPDRAEAAAPSALQRTTFTSFEVTRLSAALQGALEPPAKTPFRRP
jgi:hypothetical protein